MDCIAAISTANAPAGIGIVRLSGENALDIADRVFSSERSKKPSEMKGYTAALGYAADKSGEKIDDVIALVFTAPKSYTGENVVELSCHGGLFVTRKLLSAVLDAGARLAEAGEFTKRAFLNGKIDLAQAEAVMRLISASGEEAAKTALQGEAGILSTRIARARDRIKDTAAHLAAWADFPEEDIPEVEEDSLEGILQLCIDDLSELLREFEKGRIFADGVDAAIVGKVNAGKSTLMNLLSGRQRSIVTEIPGTTRDVVQESVMIAGIPVRLSDTAGIRETADAVERIGVSASRERMETAELVLAMFDSSRPLDDEDMEIIGALKNKRAIAVVNKTDLPSLLDERVIENGFAHVVHISAREEKGVEELSKTVESVLNTADYDPSNGALYTERQRRDAQTARSSLQEALNALQSRITLDAVTVCVENALAALYSLTGEKVSEEIINEVFEKFCVGK